MDALVKEWLRLDKNPITHREIENLVAQGNEEELEKRLGTRIEFGTAGLRGRMEAGFSRMNDLTVIQASQGLCAYVLEKVKDAQNKGIVIGHDHRHNSERWACLTAKAFIGKGVKAYLHRGLVHTPIVPFSVQHIGAACGVMITASHNPKNDNGYKVYWENAVQIIGPHDEGIASAIEKNLEPADYAWDSDAVLSSPLCVDKTEEIIEAYFLRLSKLSLTSSTNDSSPLQFVNTSMHGVGNRFVTQAFKTFNFKPFVPVQAQMDPDPEFTTVAFPNPEEKGALDRAIEEANSHNISHVLAQDPDADRFSAAEKQPNGVWKVFSGDQLGTLLAAWTLEGYKVTGGDTGKLAMVASTVSSKMLEAMAQKEGFTFVESLTGFKYIGNTALTLQDSGHHVPFGYEEAIGFMLGTTIRDKDGVAATMVFVELATSLYRNGNTIAGYLEELYQRYGYFQTSNSYFVCREPRVIDEIFARLRNWPSGTRNLIGLAYPTSLAGLSILSVRDLTVGFDSTMAPTFKPLLPLSSGHMVTFKAEGMEGKITLTIRTSGTEPKIKYYLEGSGAQRARVAELLMSVVNEIRADWMQSDARGLTEP